MIGHPIFFGDVYHADPTKAGVLAFLLLVLCDGAADQLASKVRRSRDAGSGAAKLHFGVR